MKYPIKTLLILSIPLFLFACVQNNNKTPKEKTSRQAYEQKTTAGDSSPAKKNTAQQPEIKQPLDDTSAQTQIGKNIPKNILPYTIYIPKSLAGKQGLPVMFLFDPHAMGQLPVEKYKTLADKYGIALVGSMQSKNGMTVEETYKIYDVLKTEVSKQFTPDKNQMYAMGFSGGARVAFSVAVDHPEIDGVIGAGAGLPSIRQFPKQSFYYVSIAGNEDFNMTELIDNNRNLTRSGFQNALILFDGGHDWPPVEIAREAFLLLQLKSKRPDKKDIERELEAYYHKQVENNRIADKIFEASEIAGRAISVLQDPVEIKAFEKEDEALRKNPLYREQLENTVNAMQKEIAKKNKFLNAFASKDIKWWKNQILSLRKPNSNSYEEKMNKRLLSFLGLASYMNANSAIKNKQWTQGEKDLDIYRMLEPLNPEHAYLAALIKMKKDDQDAAINYLQQARLLGFNDIQRILNEPAFTPLKGDDAFKEIIRK